VNIKHFIHFLFLLPLATLAQSTISGRILNQADKKPLSNASVFFNNTTAGSKTSGDGIFTLGPLKTGKYEMVVSSIGFETYHQTITIDNIDIKLPDIELLPKTISLSEVKIKPKIDLNWDRNYALFKKEFLGTSDLAEDCKILNPELLDLEYNDTTKILTSSSYDFLEIENPDLGYKIKYLLTSFIKNFKSGKIHYEGSFSFENLKGTTSMDARWRKKRDETYKGSEMHFLRSAQSNRIEEEGFRTLQLATYQNPQRPPDSLINAKIKFFKSINLKSGNKISRDSLAFWVAKSQMPKLVNTLMDYPLSQNDIIFSAQQPGIYALGCDNDNLLITYNKNHHFPKKGSVDNLDDPYNRSTTLVSFKKPFVFFDNNGAIIEPGSIAVNGAWLKNRVAELLPLDYEPPQNGFTSDNLTVLSNATTKLETFSTDHPNEKVYLHLDKPRYNMGDTLWFKAYTVAGQYHQLSELSGVLYTELINDKDSVVKRLTLQLHSGLAWGNITLSRNYRPGLYHLRAYTNWMRNAGSGYFFNQPIRIGGFQLALNPVKKGPSINPDIQFFPEGGSLVNEVRSKVAVKAVNASGLGEDIKGVVTDSEGNDIAEFNTQHLGMGVFAITPEQGKTYKVKVTAADSSVFTVNLPEVAEEGFTLGVNNSGADSIYVKVVASNKLFEAQKNASFFLVGQCQGKVYYTSGGKLANPVFIAGIEKSRFPSGIVQFTLFSQTGEPIAERIAFIQNPDTLKLNIISPVVNYTTRQHVTISLDVKNNDGRPILGDFSAAVINESRVGVDGAAESTIINNLLLTSDLRGYIEKPNYYFENPNDQTKADLDILMLTQGYRRFEWKQVLGDKEMPIAYQPERSLEMEGTLKTPSGKVVPKGKILLFSTKENLEKDTTTDENGNFKITDLYLSDSAKIVLRAKKQNNGSNVAIYLKEKDYPAVSKTKTQDYATGMPPELIAVLQRNYDDSQEEKRKDSLKNGISLKDVVIKARKIARPDIYNDNGARSEYDANMQKLSREFADIKEGLRAVIPGISYNGRTLYYDFKPVQIIIDGFRARVEDIDYSPKDVESIRMIDPSLLIITTKRYAGTDTASTVKLKEVKIKGSKINNIVAHSDNLNGAGNADQVLMGDRLDGCTTLSDCLRGKLFGVRFGQDGTPYNSRQSTRIANGPLAMVLVVDGNVIPGNQLNDLNPNDIYSIEELISGGNLAVYGSNASGGALIITTKRGTEGSFVTSETPAGLITYQFEGFSKSRTFYAPKYSNPATDIKTPDRRTTIYWNPNIVTDKDGKASFDYFNADTKGTYRVVIEGIDAEGNLGRQVYRYKVE
jgi:hypothetical protein